jgi:hypothetical protein
VSANHLLIKLNDYARIFRVVHSVSEAVGNTAGRACLFYNVIGAALLEVNYKIKARPVMGSAFFAVHEPSATVLAYSHRTENGQISSSSDAFHCWVQAEGCVVDFTAPVYRESIEKLGYTYKIPRKMFQKPFQLMARAHDHLAREGDFYIEPNVDLTNEMMARFFSSHAARDLGEVCMTWFTKPPKRINEKMKMSNDLGKITSMLLTDIEVSGAW